MLDGSRSGLGTESNAIEGTACCAKADGPINSNSPIHQCFMLSPQSARLLLSLEWMLVYRCSRRPSPAHVSRVITVRRPASGCTGRHDLLLRSRKTPRKRIRMPFQRNTKTKSVLFALAALLLPAFSADDAWALYPDRIVRIVVPFAPGGGTDVIARTLAQEMAKDLGATGIIEDKPGAETIIGTQAVAASEPDGYTLLMGTFANAVNPSLNARLPYDPHKDFAPVALIARSFNIVVVNPKYPIHSIAALIAA